jgi:uncharacterized protein (UPF0333 family)
MRFLLSALFLILFSSPALAQPSGKVTYSAVDAKDKSMAAIKRGIESAIDDMSFITKPIARGKLEKSNTPFETITLEVKGKSISIQHDDRKPITTNGKAVKWKRDDGESFTVTQELDGQKIVQTYTSDDGKKVMTYNFGGDNKKLIVQVVVTSSKITGPVKYTLHYTTK